MADDVKKIPGKDPNQPLYAQRDDVSRVNDEDGVTEKTKTFSMGRSRCAHESVVDD